MSTDPTAALFNRLHADGSVLGVFLSSSRGKAFHTDASDYDVYIVVTDEGLKEAEHRYPFRYGANIDCIVISISSFRAHAEPGSPDAWDRYSFAHVEVLFGRAAEEVQELVNRKGQLSTEERTQTLRDSLDAYLNAVYRTFKCLRKGNRLGAKLEAAQGIPPLLSFLFGLEGRHAPFAGYLEREMTTYPLNTLPLPVAKFLAGLEGTLQADIVAIKLFLDQVDRLGHAEGLGNVFAAWDEAYPWMLKFGLE